MKTSNRYTAALAALLLLTASLASCGDTAVQPTETQAETAADTAAVVENLIEEE